MKDESGSADPNIVLVLLLVGIGGIGAAVLLLTGWFWAAVVVFVGIIALVLWRVGTE